MLFKKKIPFQDYCTATLKAAFDHTSAEMGETLRRICADSALSAANTRLYLTHLKAVFIELMLIAITKDCSEEIYLNAVGFVHSHLKESNLSNIGELCHEYSQAFASLPTDGLAAMVQHFNAAVTAGKMQPETIERLYVEFRSVFLSYFNDFKSIKLTTAYRSLSDPAIKSLTQFAQNYSDAYRAFVAGERIWRDVSSSKGSSESKLSRIEEALEHFDEAIEKGIEGRGGSVPFVGFHESEVYALRAYCLVKLGFYFDALQDYNKAIAKKPRKDISNLYHLRGLVKMALWDIDGYLTDFDEAIRLSKLDNEDNAYWNKYSQSKGFPSQTAFYEMCCPTKDEISFKRKVSPKEISEALAKVKRRTARGVPDKPQA